MFRLSKITDYGIVLLAHLAKEALEARLTGLEPGACNARELAQAVDLPTPVVSKVLKALSRANVLESQRGATGGYRLARRPEELSVREMIAALDGPVALTECTIGPQVCEHEGSCAVRTPWQVINRAVDYALAGVTLADIVSPQFAAQQAPLLFIDVAQHDTAEPRDAVSEP